MKFVRWLGAFRSSSSVYEAAEWELKQVDRQVAAEPLWKGKSFINHAKIGLVVDESLSRFARGWLVDAWTYTDENGILKPYYSAKRRQGKAFKDMNRFLAAWNKTNPNYHGEAVFDCPVYKAVVVKSSATDHGKRRAKRLAEKLNLKLEVLKA